MRTIMVMNSKGGSGKSTVATNLAAYFAANNNKVVLVDFDPQASSMAWLNARPAARPPIRGIAAHTKDSKRAGRNTDYVIMDVAAGLHGSALSKMAGKAQSILIPVLPSPMDMRAAADFIDEDYTRIYWELDRFLSRQRIPFLTMLRDSQHYIRAAERGLGIFEMAPAATARDREQWQPIVKWIKSKRSQP